MCELPIAMLACARIGAIHNVVFAGFSSESLAQRLQDCKCGAGYAVTAYLSSTRSFKLSCRATHLVLLPLNGASQSEPC